ncbi:hypothetical protein NE237_006680 [Protea cynaroides]|uniref:Uncharacterized protein n=1 Tax=Protea cynaroides TaxID=273540 RepID=A0A9Q0KNP3_9MAGN|nr:hypothetical protein NE237_006680 [Protea cynaroides]
MDALFLLLTSKFAIVFIVLDPLASVILWFVELESVVAMISFQETAYSVARQLLGGWNGKLQSLNSPLFQLVASLNQVILQLQSLTHQHNDNSLSIVGFPILNCLISLSTRPCDPTKQVVCCYCTCNYTAATSEPQTRFS